MMGLRTTAIASIILIVAAHTYAEPPMDYQHAPGGIAASSRLQWARAVEGENLALGRPVLFSVAPDDPLTTDENDAYDLTDGKLSAREDDRLWFEKDAVGWSYRGGEVNMLIDLGQVQPVGRVAVRFLGGAEQRSLLYPQEIAVVGSDDGKTYYSIAKRRKLLPAEKELAERNPDEFYFLPENGVASTDTFVFDIHRKTRYVGLMVKGDGNFFYTDQIAIIKDTQPDRCQALANGLERTYFVTRGVAVRPRQRDGIVITTNIVTPNYFVITDARKKPDKPQRLYFILPDVLDLKLPIGTATKLPWAKAGYARWAIDDFYKSDGDFFTNGGYNTIYFSLSPGKTPPADAVATLYADGPESKDNILEVPVRFIEIPAARPMKRLDVTMAWMNELGTWASNPDMVQMPDALKTLKHLGFNTIPTFPRYFTEDYYAQFQEETLRKTISDARALGLRVVLNESSFHRMLNKHADNPEIYNVVNGKKGEYVCPSYTGTYYQDEIKSMARLARVVQPDQVFHDDEMWYYPAQEAVYCSVCQEKFKKSGLRTFDEYLQAQGMRMMRDLYNAVANTAPGGQTPVVGLYNVHIGSPIYEKVFNFNLIYPKYVQLSQPSLYVQSKAQLAHDVVQDNYRRLKSNHIVPWITAGTYGEFPPKYLEKILLECYLNGASGVAYFMFMDFDPMDFYYHAYTINLLSPYEDLLADGKPVVARIDNDQITCSAWGNQKEALVLLANYSRTPHGRVNLGFEQGQPVRVLDVKTDAEISPESLQAMDIKPDEHRLLHVQFQP